jgi:hypothetical protein
MTVLKLVSRRIHGDRVEHLQLAGSLLLNVGEWQILGAALLIGGRQTHGQLRILTEGDQGVVGDGDTADGNANVKR